MVWWDDIAKILLIELNVCFESSFKHAAERKTTKYLDVLARARSSGYRGQVIIFEVGSRGIIDDSGFSCLKKEFQIKARDLSQLLIRISRTAIMMQEEQYHPIIITTIYGRCKKKSSHLLSVQRDG